MIIAGFQLSDALLTGVVGGVLTLLIELVRTRRMARQMQVKQDKQAEVVENVVSSVDTVVAEVKPNGGSSMRDAVNRIEAAVVTLTEAQKRSEERDTDHSERLRVLEDRTAPRSFWRR